MTQPDFLQEILRRRRARVMEDFAVRGRNGRRRAVERAREKKDSRRLSGALRENNGVKIIGEFKRASPSRGIIRADADPAEMVPIYAAAGVSAISVLTEPDFFAGSLEDLRRARAATTLPILQKDFIVADHQIHEAADAGADAILLIVAALTDTELLRFRMLAEEELGLDALVEVHAGEEMNRAEACGAKLIGVNNRDLRTLTTSLETSLQLAALAPADATLVSESGISSPAQIAKLRRCGYRGFLVGESLMSATDPTALIRALRCEGNPELRHA